MFYECKLFKVKEKDKKAFFMIKIRSPRFHVDNHDNNKTVFYW
jgi:hypothetical protein